MLAKGPKGNMELKLAISHIRTWFARHNIHPEDLTLAIRIKSERDRFQADAAYKADMEPGDVTSPNQIDGVNLVLESENQLLAHIGRQNLEIAELKRELEELRK